MRPRPFDVVSLVSFLACAAIAVLCVRSPAGGDRIDVNVFRVRHTIVCHHGRIVIAAPQRGAPAAEARAWELAASLRNEDISWVFCAAPPCTPRWCAVGDTPRRGTSGLCPTPRTGSSAAALEGMPPADVLRPLLSSLDDPQRAVAAHVLLSDGYSTPPVDWTDFPAARVVSYDGMHVALKMPMPGRPAFRPDGSAAITYAGPGSWTYDPAELPALRQRWHARLTGPVASFSLVPPIAALAVAPAVWLWFMLARLAANEPNPTGFRPLLRRRVQA